MQNSHPRSTLKRAHELLGTHQFPEAKALCEQLCVSDGRNAESWLLLGMANKGLGQAEGALEAFERAVMLRPRDAFIQNEKGMLLAQLGRFHEAIAAFRQALQEVPDAAMLHVNIGVAYGFMRQYPEALAALDQAARLDPHSGAVQVQRSTVLGWLGRHAEALSAAELAVRLDRSSLEANLRYSEALVALERFDEALTAYGNCLSIAPDFLPARQRVLEICRKATLTSPAVAHYELLQRAYGWRDVNLQDIAAFAASVFKTRAGFMEALQSVPDMNGASREDNLAALRDMAGTHRLYFEGLLSQSLLEDAQLEVATTGFRSRLLQVLWMHCDAWAEKIPPELELLLASLSQQCFNNEYVWASTDAEDRLVETIAVEVESGWRASSEGVISAALALRTWLVALYRPLYSVLPPGCDINAASSPLMRQTFQLQYAEYWQEQQIKSGIKALTPIAEGVSTAVRRQYEENPYPRWQSLPPVESISPAVRLGELFSAGNMPAYVGQPMEILIAGCGTGRHSIQTAWKFPESRITAIDLSLTSLAYAARKSSELHVANVTYFQADIMALGGLDKRYHVIESIGVLHHLEDPLAGWRKLTELLVPGGVMHIALYSQIARGKLNPAREHIKQSGLGSDAGSIRAFREQVLHAPEGTTLAETARLGRDFYSLSNCRDLLFHVQEHQFTLLEIAAMLDKLGLQFLAMETDPWVREDYARFNPNDDRGTDLAGWHRYELEHPLTFAGMYQFWCQLG